MEGTHVWTFRREELDLCCLVILLRIDLAVVDVLSAFDGLCFATNGSERGRLNVSMRSSSIGIQRYSHHSRRKEELHHQSVRRLTSPDDTPAMMIVVGWCERVDCNNDGK